MRRTLSFIDGTLLAPWATCPVLYSVALMDTVCPPSTVFASFTAWGGSDKEIAVYEFNGHEGGGALHERRRLEWLDQQVG
ncbi:acetylxylan esterase [Brachybacterium sillae]|uniref:acetylxylan esterase n=1 Tax=Brachybacterium sillae TaxID=2810536 RepID=UPI0032E7F525